MSKIIQAINAMISNEKKIKNIIQGNDEAEYYFTYDGRHSWSLNFDDEDNYYLHYYPGKPDLEYISRLSVREWSLDIIKVSYSSRDFPGKEAYESFRELYMILKEKAYGMDEILQEIIESDIPF